MIKVMYGRKGTGKTKVLIDTANSFVSANSANVVFIDYTKKLMYDLKHKIRFVDASEFPIRTYQEFIGFLCGIISSDFDIKHIVIDGLNYIVREDTSDETVLQTFFDKLRKISSQFNIEFYISMNGEAETMPCCIKEFVA